MAARTQRTTTDRFFVTPTMIASSISRYMFIRPRELPIRALARRYIASAFVSQTFENLSSITVPNNNSLTKTTNRRQM